MKKVDICEECGQRIGMLHCSECNKNLCHKCLFTDKCKGCFTDSIDDIFKNEETWENTLTEFRL
jgi:hypothetical protein